MKGIILHGGAGTRLRPLTFSGPKQLVPVANKPISQYVLEDLLAAGIEDIAIVLGNTFPELVREHYGDGERFGCRISYIHQGDPLGIAHAVYLAKDFVAGDKFVVYLGDNLLQGGIAEYIKTFDENDYDAMILLKEVDDPRMFGVAELDEDGALLRLVEKPKEPPSNLVVIGVYFFKPVVFDIIPRLKPSWRGELEITDTIQLMLDSGHHVGYEIVRGWWIDTGKKDDILHANMLLLDENSKREIDGSSKVMDSRIDGRVRVEEGSVIENSLIRGPAIIGRNCIIRGSFIGPYTSVGEGSLIENSSLENTVVMQGVTIRNIEMLEDSLIGKNAKVLRKMGTGNRRRLTLNVGDHSEVVL